MNWRGEPVHRGYCKGEPCGKEVRGTFRPVSMISPCRATRFPARRSG